MYGLELILDLYGCDQSKFNRKSIKKWLDKLCELIDMEQEDLHFWDYEDMPEEKENVPVHLAGTSAIQFISTSNIVIHTLDKVRECYINIFSCKDYNCSIAKTFTQDSFKAKRVEMKVIIRGEHSRCDTDIPDDCCMACISHGHCSGPQWIRQPCSNFKPEQDEPHRHWSQQSRGIASIVERKSK